APSGAGEAGVEGTVAAPCDWAALSAGAACGPAPWASAGAGGDGGLSSCALASPPGDPDAGAIDVDIETGSSLGAAAAGGAPGSWAVTLTARSLPSGRNGSRNASSALGPTSP